jgi:phosphohistidine phosphatase
MQRLILLRHAKAERSAPSGEDFDRALADRGRTDARLMGKVLADAGLVPTLALVSSAARTRQTWEEASRAFATEIEARYDKRHYNASSTELRRLVEDLEDQDGTLILVGHNPGIHQLALTLLIEGAAAASTIARITSKFPTASAVAFEMDAVGRATYDGVFFAADYGGGGAD